jgi:hypothetical protein
LVIGYHNSTPTTLGKGFNHLAKKWPECPASADCVEEVGFEVIVAAQIVGA